MLDKRDILDLLKLYTEEVRYHHSVIWLGERFFTVAIATLLGIALAVVGVGALDLPLRLQASIFLVVLGIVLAIMGRYVLINESRFFLGDIYSLVVLRKKLGLHEFSVGDRPILSEEQLRAIAIPRGEWIEQKVLSDTGIRYAFRILYLLYVVIGLSLYLVLLLWLSNIGDVPGTIVDLWRFLFVAILLTSVVYFRWEILSIAKSMPKTLRSLWNGWKNRKET